MQTNSNLSYRRKDNDIVVKTDGGKSQIFPNAKGAYHAGDEVVVHTALGTVRVDKFGNRKY